MAAEKKAEKKPAAQKFGDDRKKALEVALGKIEKDFFGNPQVELKLVSRKPITASEEELMENNRSRSAKLRVAEKM